ncbi:hypothetical protein D9M71_823340 [compost metagenome]
MKPGVSQSESMGISKASHSCMKRAALSPAWASMAPPRCMGLLANRPKGLPSIRMKAVIRPGANCRRSSSTEPRSARVSIKVRMS